MAFNFGKQKKEQQMVAESGAPEKVEEVVKETPPTVEEKSVNMFGMVKLKNNNWAVVEMKFDANNMKSLTTDAKVIAEDGAKHMIFEELKQRIVHEYFIYNQQT